MTASPIVPTALGPCFRAMPLHRQHDLLRQGSASASRAQRHPASSRHGFSKPVIFAVNTTTTPWPESDHADGFCLPLQESGPARYAVRTKLANFFCVPNRALTAIADAVQCPRATVTPPASYATKISSVVEIARHKPPTAIIAGREARTLFIGPVDDADRRLGPRSRRH